MTTSPNNPWNEVYKLANNKTRSNQKITTLQKSDDRNAPTNAGPADPRGQPQGRHNLPHDNSEANKTTTIHHG
jgi:hypothetical protein